jgi:hypothetical protein
MGRDWEFQKVTDETKETKPIISKIQIRTYVLMSDY